MEIDKLDYTKKTGSEPLRSVRPTLAVSNAIETVQPRNSIRSSAHEKGLAMLSPAVVYILSGGEDREKNYFKALRNNSVLSSCVHVLFQSRKGQGLQPYQMEEQWQKIRKTGKLTLEGVEYRINSIDSVYLVTDVDEFEHQLVKILKNKDRSDNGSWIISNPCFEIWLYYCYRSDIDAKVNDIRYVSRKKRSQRMKALNHELIHGGADPRKAFDNTKEGIANSTAHYRTRHYRIPGLFATSMHLMMTEILGFITERGRSFEEYQEAKRKRIEAFLLKNA